MSEKVMMSLTGDRTRAIFDRYNIVTEEDVLKATQRMAEHVRGDAKTPNVRKLRK